MKFSSAFALGFATQVLAKAAHNVYPVKAREVKRDGHLKSQMIPMAELPNGAAELIKLGMSGAGLTAGGATKTDVIIIWVNGGGGVATTRINEQSTVTVTKTVGGGGGGGTAPPPAATPPAPPTEGGAVAPPPPAAAPPGAQATHQVTVGGPKGLSFEPQELKAAIGDMVVFTFLSQNHTATQSAFDTPCDPLAGGMDSGFQTNANNTMNPPPQVAMQVMVETPLWFFCRQGNHCGNGMVFSINPTAAKTHANFQSLAIKQKGKGKNTAITGGAAAPGAGAAAPPPAAAPAAGAGSALPPAPAAGAVAGSGPQRGAGQTLPDGSCQCTVICGAGSFPAVAAQGLGAFGGMPGSVPAAMMGI
ncbi:hypothetical protein GGTG_13003 [Gaeumannomyces tritici R3-111a-1]|uniref:Serine-threonine rich protein n=1 Tax=Gaeumannomyces tritici (strain R3-111a-1) TaxID=644352 RepID=J3PHM3_GAET3|nr:hypothetical protein GGTG_13003 [Gaeumannomyces tritici R3-111a-1]EJT69384.1 hypothetical protein GGTG_13003 [Gaeumannomyces tritici R3-111a-1]